MVLLQLSEGICFHSLDKSNRLLHIKTVCTIFQAKIYNMECNFKQQQIIQYYESESVSAIRQFLFRFFEIRNQIFGIGSERVTNYFVCAIFSLLYKYQVINIL